jgi:pullulanase
MTKSYYLLLLGAFALLGGACSPSKTTKSNIPERPATPTMSFDQYPEYKGNDLGVRWKPMETQVKIWSPQAEAVRFYLYNQGLGGTHLSVTELMKQPQGIWSAQLKGNYLNKYYTIQVKTNGQWLPETPDPYAVAVGANGQRGMIVNLSATNPIGWEKDKRPPLARPTDIILYELHVRDFSINANSGLRNAGKYLAFTEKGSQNPSGYSTGIDHLRELGITHVHLLPVFDYRYTSVDETRLNEAQYNWGYDPDNYNVPEGSYSTNPNDGNVRIREFKSAIQAMHESGIRVVMDVVYNHTGATNESVFNRTVPGYYYRQRADGTFSDASACGNETASERAMVRRYMVESMLYWAKEYHIDGFRVDLMGIHDIETMNQISAELHKLDPTIFVYGEGWTAGSSPLPDSLRAIKANTHRLDRVAAFSDDMRDALKGSVFNHEDRGFVSAKPGQEESIKFGIAAATRHSQVDYSKVNYSKAPWAAQPEQCINYAECHDNHTLWDRLLQSRPDATEAERIRMHQLAMTMVLTAQGVPFIHAGAEMLRTKNGVENSYKSPDAINQMDWDRKTKYLSTFELYKKLIQLRKGHPAFRLPDNTAIQKHLSFLPVTQSNVVAFELSQVPKERWQRILVVHNGNSEAKSVDLPKGNWVKVLENHQLDEKGFAKATGTQVSVAAYSTTILVQM